MTTFAFGNDVKRRTALFGVLALFAFCLFVLGAVIGAWAEVVRIWPVRYSLQLLEGPPEALRRTNPSRCRSRSIPRGAS